MEPVTRAPHPVQAAIAEVITHSRANTAARNRIGCAALIGVDWATGTASVRGAGRAAAP